MKVNKEITLTAEDVELAIKEYVFNQTKNIVEEINYSTIVTGDYDKGTAKTNIRLVNCIIK